jgi:hypothetical protein
MSHCVFPSPRNSSFSAESTGRSAAADKCIYANHGCYSFGLEAAGVFRSRGLIRDEELEALAHDIALWRFPRENNKTI